MQTGIQLPLLLDVYLNNLFAMQSVGILETVLWENECSLIKALLYIFGYYSLRFSVLYNMLNQRPLEELLLRNLTIIHLTEEGRNFLMAQQSSLQITKTALNLKLLNNPLASNLSIPFSPPWCQKRKYNQVPSSVTI